MFKYFDMKWNKTVLRNKHWLVLQKWKIPGFYFSNYSSHIKATVTGRCSAYTQCIRFLKSGTTSPADRYNLPVALTLTKGGSEMTESNAEMMVFYENKAGPRSKKKKTTKQPDF